MEAQKLTVTESRLANTTIDLTKALFHVNYLTAFPYSDAILVGWANSLIEIEPEIDSKVVKWIVDNMKTGLIDFNPRIGIQNIFNGFRKYIDANRNEDEKWKTLYRKYNYNTCKLTM